MEEREKMVKFMWDVYTNSQRIRLLRFWQEAFGAAYENLASDAPGVRGEAISEIAKMSLRYTDFEPPPLQSLSMRELRLKQAVRGKKWGDFCSYQAAMTRRNFGCKATESTC